MLHLILFVLLFHLWWPIGLAALAFFLIRRNRWRRMQYAGNTPMMNCNSDRWERRMARTQEKFDRLRERAAANGWFAGAPSGSGNSAFDEYRSETLRRLEDEQRDFKGFLERLRFAKDRSEFDQFMADRRSRPETTPPAAPEAPSHPQG